MTAPVPVVEDYAGAATVVTCTVGFDRDGAPERGAVICEGAHGERTAAAVHDRDTLELLTDGTDSYRLAQATAGKGVTPLT